MISEHSQSNSQWCSHCHTHIPPDATFCGICGERLNRQSRTALLNRADIADRYRIISLVRRHLSIQLFVAIDNQQQQPVVIRDIDLSSLNQQGLAQAVEVAQQEYDLLRYLNIPDVMPATDLYYFQEHLYMIASWPFGFHTHTPGKASVPCYTLQDLLQSGVGLPSEQVAITWIYRLCYAVERLHQKGIMIGHLDPHSIIVSDKDYEGLPALMISWLPLSMRHLLPYISTITNTAHFVAPEAQHGSVESSSDVYSLGALLYLLLTGVAPEDPSTYEQHPLRSLRDMTPKLSSNIDALMMRALAAKTKDRFGSAEEMAEALLELCIGTRPVRATNTIFSRQMRHDEQEQAKSEQMQPNTDDRATLQANPSEHAPMIAPRSKQLRRQLTKVLTSSLKIRIAHMSDVLGVTEDREQTTASQHTSDTEASLTDRSSDAPAESSQNPSAAQATQEDCPRDPQSIIIEELSMGMDPITETETMLEPSTTNTEVVNDAPSKESKTMVESSSTEAETVIESSFKEAEVVTGPLLIETEEAIVSSAPETEAVTLAAEMVIETNAKEETKDQQDAQAIEATPPKTEQQEVHLADSSPLQIQSIPDDQITESQRQESISSAQDVDAIEAVSIESEAVREDLAEAQPEPPLAPEVAPRAAEIPKSSSTTSTEHSLMQRLIGRVSGVLPAVPRLPKTTTDGEDPLLKRLQRFVLGEQQHTTTAAALIETPLRIQPNQTYTIRIHIMGRDEPSIDSGSAEAGLSALVQEEMVHIEIRSALYRNFAYIVQQADVMIPKKGYAAEVTMPMQALSHGPSGRRERLHIFFTDGQRRPLYERPFVIEVFISHLVQSGREGHNVLTIPV